MLILKRSLSEQVFITVPPSSEPTTIVVTLAELRSNAAKFGFDAPSQVEIHRSEIHARIAGQTETGDAA